MIEVGESTGACRPCSTSVAEFYEDDVSTRVTASLTLIEPAIMIFMGIFIGFVLISLVLADLFAGGLDAQLRVFGPFDDCSHICAHQ